MCKWQRIHISLSLNRSYFSPKWSWLCLRVPKEVSSPYSQTNLSAFIMTRCHSFIHSIGTERLPLRGQSLSDISVWSSWGIHYIPPVYSSSPLSAFIAGKWLEEMLTAASAEEVRCGPPGQECAKDAASWCPHSLGSRVSAQCWVRWGGREHGPPHPGPLFDVWAQTRAPSLWEKKKFL